MPVLNDEHGLALNGNLSVEYSFGAGARSGTKIVARRPAIAAKPARLDAALPVEAHAIPGAPCCAACSMPTLEARSLKLPVGFRPSSLSRSLATPAHMMGMASSLIVLSAAASADKP